MTNTNAKFETGRRYFCRSIGDYNCVWRFEIVRRTAKSVWIVEVDSNDEPKRRAIKISGYDGREFFEPFGSYSMSPAVYADNPVEDDVDACEDTADVDDARRAAVAPTAYHAACMTEKLAEELATGNYRFGFDVEGLRGGVFNAGVQRAEALARRMADANRALAKIGRAGIVLEQWGTRIDRSA